MTDAQMLQHAGETGLFVFGAVSVPYTIIRSSRRRRTVALSLERDGLTIMAPAGAGREAIERIAKRRSAWIVRKLADLKEVRQHPVREFINGESIQYLGRHYRLRVIESSDHRASARLKGAWLEVAVSPAADQQVLSNTVNACILRWFRSQAAAHLHTRVAQWSTQMGVTCTGVMISDPQKRWGSCDQGNLLRFNWRIMMAPSSLIDYVVVHELCHVVHKDHSDDFWRLLASVMPDYDLRRQELKKTGPSFTLLGPKIAPKGGIK